MEAEYKYKTSKYQRKANLVYMENIKNDPVKYAEYIEKRKANQNAYYQRNKEKILAKMKAKRDQAKNTLG